MEKIPSNLQVLCQQIPKIELHAHLSGSISRTTLRQIAIEQNNFECIAYFEKFKNRTLKEDFQMFEIIHKLLYDLKTIEKTTKSVLEDFSQDNVVYLELRSSLKKTPNFNEEEYLKTILDQILNFSQEKMIVRLILSIDRSRSVEQAQVVLDLFKKYKKLPQYEKILVGLDYSGNPFKNTFLDFLHIFQEAKNQGIKTAVHIAETPDSECRKETTEILNFKPDRLGHFNYYDEELLQLVKESKIPIEMCPTSNKCTMQLKSLKEHHFMNFFSIGYPLCICTDDKGVFEQSLSEELANISNDFALQYDQLKSLVSMSVELIFDEDAKPHLRTKVMEIFRKMDGQHEQLNSQRIN